MDSEEREYFFYLKISGMISSNSRIQDPGFLCGNYFYRSSGVLLCAGCIPRLQHTAARGSSRAAASCVQARVGDEEVIWPARCSKREKYNLFDHWSVISNWTKTRSDSHNSILINYPTDRMF